MLCCFKYSNSMPMVPVDATKQHTHIPQEIPPNEQKVFDTERRRRTRQLVAHPFSDSTVKKQRPPNRRNGTGTSSNGSNTRSQKQDYSYIGRTTLPTANGKHIYICK